MTLRFPASHCLVPAALAFSTVFAADPAKPADSLPPPEATEYWEPVPAVVAAPAGGIPSDAVVLFNGQGLGAWESVKGGAAPWTAEGDAVVEGKSQGRGNSGVFFMGLYELQVLDSHNNPTYVNGQAGSIYKQHPPLVNASRGPGEWQTYDVVFVAPRFAADGKLVSPARITAFHNGVLVQHDVVLSGPTVYRGQPAYAPHAAKLPLELQDHNNVTAFRNIWVREITLPAAP